jgi:hypothetical protein
VAAASTPTLVPELAGLLPATMDAWQRAAGALRKCETRAISLARALEGIDLPDLSSPARSADDQALIRSVAPLYLGAQLEDARLMAVAERLAGLAVTGGLPPTTRTGAELLVQFWKTRHERFDEKERRTFYRRLFGPSLIEAASAAPHENVAFEDLMLQLSETLYKLDEGATDARFGSLQQQVRLRSMASTLVDNLLQFSGSALAIAARDVLTTVGEALSILKSADVQAAFGTRSVWDLVRSLTRRYEAADPPIASYVSRGRSGVVLLSWLADSVPGLGDAAAPLAELGSEARAAAAEWLQATYDLAAQVHPPRGN